MVAGTHRPGNHLTMPTLEILSLSPQLDAYASS